MNNRTFNALFKEISEYLFTNFLSLYSDECNRETRKEYKQRSELCQICCSGCNLGLAVIKWS